MDVGIDVKLPLFHLSVIDDDGKDDDDVEEKQDNDDDDKAAGTPSCCTSAGHPQTALLLYTHLSVVAATYHINSSPSPLSSGLQILKQLAVDV